MCIRDRYEHVDMIGGVTRLGVLSGLKCWNSDNLFDWIDFFKINTYFYFFDERQNVKQYREFFGTRSCSLWRMLISVNQNAECGGKRERTNFDRSFFTYWQVFFFYWILLEKRFYVVWIYFHRLSQYQLRGLVAWNKLIQNLFTVVTSAEATTLNEKIHKHWIAKEKNIEFIFFRTLICITQVLLRTIRDNLTASWTS